MNRKRAVEAIFQITEPETWLRIRDEAGTLYPSREELLDAFKKVADYAEAYKSFTEDARVWKAVKKAYVKMGYAKAVYIANKRHLDWFENLGDRYKKAGDWEEWLEEESRG